MAVGTGDIVRVTVDGERSVTLQQIQNVWYMRNEGTSLSEADALDDIVELLEALYQLMAAILSTAVIIQRIRAINITDNSDVGIGFFTDSTPGTDAGSTFSPQAAMGLTLTTARLSVRGRKFFGVVPVSAADPRGVIVAGTILDLADAGDYVTQPQAATHNSWTFGVRASSDGAWLPFESYTISTTLVTQRRRRAGVGI